MLIGHYAPALVLHRARPSVKLWQLFVAVQFVDVLWAVFVLLGIEHARIVPGFTEANDLDLWHMPFSHSLVATLGWSLLAFLWYRASGRASQRSADALVVAAAVASHYATDLLVHVPDLPVMTSGGTKLGLGLWRHRSFALALETGIFAAAALWWWWPRRTAAGTQAAGAVLLLLTVITAATFYIPTPPTPWAMALIGLSTYGALGALGAWLERSGPTAVSAASS